MSQQINELYDLSENKPLFTYLHQGGELSGIAKVLAHAPAPKGNKAKLFASIRDVVVTALHASDVVALEQLVSDSETKDRVVILGELILTLHSLAEGKLAGESVEAMLKVALQLAWANVADFEGNPPQDAGDEELVVHATAMREWAYHFANFYKANGQWPYYAEMLMMRARTTNTTLSSWPHLVGAAMVDVALALEVIGKSEMAMQCYEGVRLDLRYIMTRPVNSNYEWETTCALFWLQRACEERLRLVPSDNEASVDLDSVRKLRLERGYSDAVSEPRFGPIARTYLERIPYLACIIRDINKTASREECIASICAKYGCFTHEVEFYLSAIGSHEVRRTILAGVHMMYDEPHMEVFAAIDYLEQQIRP